MKGKIIFVAVVLIASGVIFAGCAKKAVRTDVGVEIAPKVEAIKPAPPEEPAKAPEPVKEAVPEAAPETPAKVEEPIEEAPPVKEAVKEKEPEKAVMAMKEPEPAKPEPVSLTDVFFDFDRYSIRDEEKSALESNARILKGRNDLSVVIEGHCDERGTDEYNIALGEKRATAVKKYLSDLGVNPGRIETVSYGTEKPFCTEHSEQCWQENRRAHFLVK